MTGTSDIRFRCRFVLPALGLLATVALATGFAGPAFAQADRSAVAANGAHASLPYTVGRVHRNRQGRIVPDLGPAPQTESYESAPGTVPPRSRPHVLPHRGPWVHFEPEGQRLSQLANQRQREIERIVEEERLAKQRGAQVNAQGLTRREEMLVLELRRTDREVRAHELAHYYTGRPYTAVPEYWFAVGPLGNRYAVAGHVRFDFSAVPGDLKATLRKYETLRRAALAPSQPSTFDLGIAMELDRSIADLRAEIAQHPTARVASKSHK